MKTDYEKQAADFLSANGIKFRATLSDSKVAPWSGERKFHRLIDNITEPHHYRVTLSKGRPCTASYTGNVCSSYRLTFDFWGSISDAEKGQRTVTPYDVLACISGDMNTPETFADFCSEFGYESDSIKALQVFRRCSSFAKRLRAFFTTSEIGALQEIQ